MSASDIEGKSPQNGEVGGSVVFPTSRLILVEEDVEHPVQDVSMPQCWRTMRSSSAGV
jgi:hypothetical protein